MFAEEREGARCYVVTCYMVDVVEDVVEESRI